MAVLRWTARLLMAGAIFLAGGWLVLHAVTDVPPSDVTVSMAATNVSSDIFLPNVHLGVSPNVRGVASVDLVVLVRSLSISSLSLDLWDQEIGPTDRPPDTVTTFGVQNQGVVFGSFSLGTKGSLFDHNRTYNFALVDNQGRSVASGTINTNLTPRPDPSSAIVRTLEALTGLITVVLQLAGLFLPSGLAVVAPRRSTGGGKQADNRGKSRNGKAPAGHGKSPAGHAKPLPDSGKPLPDSGKPLPDSGKPLPDSGKPPADSGKPPTSP
jgi:hypothetical protein